MVGNVTYTRRSIGPFHSVVIEADPVWPDHGCSGTIAVTVVRDGIIPGTAERYGETFPTSAVFNGSSH